MQPLSHMFVSTFAMFSVLTTVLSSLSQGIKIQNVHKKATADRKFARKEKRVHKTNELCEIKKDQGKKR